MSYGLDKPIIAIVGSKDSGKTLAVEALVQGLSSKGYRVATVKHIPKVNFTIDQEGTDTWRHARAGAKVVVSVSPDELATIKRVDTRDYGLAKIIMECGEDTDVVVLEGFKKLVKKDPRIIKLVAVKNVEEIQEASKEFSTILAYVGSISAEHLPKSFNYMSLFEEREKLVNLVYERAEAFMKGLKPRVATISVDRRFVPCKRFVQEFIRKTVLAMISSLRGVDLAGDEEVYVAIRSKKPGK